MGTLRKYVKEKGKGKKFEDKKDDDKALFEDNFPAVQEGNLGTSGYLENAQNKRNQLNQILDVHNGINVKAEEISK